MKKKVLVLFLLISLPLFSQTKKDKIADHIIALHQKKFDFMISKQFDSLSLLLDADLSYIHSNGWIETKDELIANIKSGKLVYKRVSVSEAKVRIKRNTAILTAEGTYFVTMDNTDIEIKLLYSEVYIKEKGKWLLIHRQSSKLV
jgi:hypothetical protein